MVLPHSFALKRGTFGFQWCFASLTNQALRPVAAQCFHVGRCCTAEDLSHNEGHRGVECVVWLALELQGGVSWHQPDTGLADGLVRLDCPRDIKVKLSIGSC